jgi:hypothetical protein
MAEPAQPEQEPRGRRARVWVAAAVLLALAVLGAALALRAPALAEEGLLRAARALGYADVALSVREVGPGHIALADVRVGAEGELSAEAIELGWSARGLLARRLDRVALRGLRVRAVWDDAGLRVPALEPLAAAPAAPAEPTPAAADAARPLVPALPAREVVLEAARFELLGAAAPAALDLDAELRLAASGAPERVRLALAATPFPPLLAAPLAARAELDADAGGALRGDASAESADGRLRAALALPGGGAEGWLSLSVHGLPLAPLAPQSGVAGRADLALEGALAASADALSLRLHRCASLRLPELALAEVGALARGLELCVEPRSEPLLALRLAPADQRAARVSLSLAPAPFELQLAAGPKLTGNAPRALVEVEQALSGAGPPALHVSADGGELGAPGWLAPLALAAQADYEGGALQASARATGASGAPELSVALRLDAAGDGEASARLAPLRFGPDRPTPPELLPALRGWIDSASGELSGEARVRLARGAPADSDARLELRDLGFAGAGARLSGLRGAARLTGWPPRSPGPELFEIARVESGAAFEEIAVRFELQPDGALDLHELRARGLGGALRAVGRVQAGAGRQALLLELHALSLAEVLAAADVAGLAGDGVITGATQLALVGGKAFFEHGQLAAVGPGALRYRPPGQHAPSYAAPQGLDLARAALYDFHYQRLSGTLAGQVDGELALSLRLEGANPALYGGHPMDLELNLKGGLYGLFRSSQSVLRVPESLERRLREGVRR